MIPAHSKCDGIYVFSLVDQKKSGATLETSQPTSPDNAIVSHVVPMKLYISFPDNQPICRHVPIHLYTAPLCFRWSSQQYRLISSFQSSLKIHFFPKAFPKESLRGKSQDQESYGSLAHCTSDLYKLSRYNVLAILLYYKFQSLCYYLFYLLGIVG